ncbi:hypothetical protein [Phaeodactylibacter xiamenensis]|uniref:hypothetical protein n=1 Tax=Phaeodactylibacter xiamenensis TaxID=1524460 RepID=UPI0024A8708C|nr:hypothetical protein [Phaeodactylibacter xiamenensis]
MKMDSKGVWLCFALLLTAYGQIAAQAGTCLKCKGLGSVPFYTTDDYGNSSFIYIACRRCNGTEKSVNVNAPDVKPEKKKLETLNALIGKWQYIHSDFTTYRFTQQFFGDGSCLSVIEFLNPFWNSWSVNATYPREYSWGYVKTNDQSGILEQYQGGELVNRFSVQWTSPNTFTAKLAFTTEYAINKSGWFYFQRSV